MRRSRGAGPGIALVLAVAAGCDLGQGVEPPPTLPQAAATTTESASTGARSGPQPGPIVLRGVAPSTERVRVTEPGPLLASAHFSGSGRVSVVATGAGTEILFFQGRAPLAARRAAWSVEPGLFTVRIRAPGTWRIEFSEPRPDPSAEAPLVGDFEGHGADALPVRIGDVSPSEVTVAYPSRGRFGLSLIPYGRFSEPIQLVDAPRGPVRDRFPVGAAPAESYLLQVDADGPWRVTFR